VDTTPASDVLYLVYSDDNGATWSAVVSLFSGGTGVTHPTAHSLFYEPVSKELMVLYGSPTTASYVRRRKSYAGSFTGISGTWGLELPSAFFTTSMAPHFPNMHISASGYVHAVYSRNNAGNKLYWMHGYCAHVCRNNDL
jgi:hypothetical protein